MNPIWGSQVHAEIALFTIIIISINNTNSWLRLDSGRLLHISNYLNSGRETSIFAGYLISFSFSCLHLPASPGQLQTRRDLSLSSPASLPHVDIQDLILTIRFRETFPVTNGPQDWYLAKSVTSPTISAPVEGCWFGLSKNLKCLCVYLSFLAYHNSSSGMIFIPHREFSLGVLLCLHFSHEHLGKTNGKNCLIFKVLP